MRPILLIYRLFYGAYLTLILAVLVRQISSRMQTYSPETALLALCGLTTAFAIFATIFFERLAEWLVWVAILMFCGFYTWYAWYSPEAPFVLHEVHSFDPVEVAAEMGHFHLRGVIVYSALVVWYLSLPVIRSARARLKSEP